jgi:hypothetical protein
METTADFNRRGADDLDMAASRKAIHYYPLIRVNIPF